MGKSPFKVLSAIAALEFLRAPGFLRTEELTEEAKHATVEARDRTMFNVIAIDSALQPAAPKRAELEAADVS